MNVFNIIIIRKMIKRFSFLFLMIVGIFSTSYSFPLTDKDFFGVKTVCIDAGHGGKDGGCHGAVANEKDIALSIALKLGEYISANFKDVKVVYTRTTDVFIELNERANIANKAKADLFICIHANAGGASAIGTETYVMGLHVSKANLKVAQRENSSILMEDDYQTKYENFDPNSPESYIIFSMRQNAFLDQSLSLASKVQKQFTERVGRKNRGVKQAGFLVLYKTAMPSVLIETGFLTNKEEEEFLNSKIGQDYLASAIYRAFKEYKLEIEDKAKEKAIEKQGKIVKEEPKTIVESGKKSKKKNKKEPEEGVVFKIQIATSSIKKALTPENFNGLEDVNIYEAGGLYRYTVGHEKTISSANILQLKLKERGYKDAFIVAFSDGKRIPLSEAMKLQAK